jgi:hypothetical protein
VCLVVQIKEKGRGKKANILTYNRLRTTLNKLVNLLRCSNPVFVVIFLEQGISRKGKVQYATSDASNQY